YEAPDTDSTSTSVGLQGGYSHAFTETLSGTVRGGVITTKMEFLSFSNNALRQDEERVNGTFFSAGVTKQFETTTWEASASRSLSPTGSGYLSVTDEVQLEIKREFRPRWRGNLGFNIFDKGSQGDRNTSGNRRRAELSAGLSWDLSRWWRLRGDYRYVRQKYENAAEAADANRFMFSLVYHDHKRAISR
ncbi:MAG: outer membrane beta-barrel protein, partial [Gammaproteobacteria bacterium]|nr:outer membrane beta-barrel protein [Gammaproteobacteria bacterium]